MKISHDDRAIIAKLDLPAGLKGLLLSNGFTVEHLLNMSSSNIADTLGIDHDAARLIIHSIRQVGLTYCGKT